MSVNWTRSQQSSVVGLVFPCRRPGIRPWTCVDKEQRRNTLRGICCRADRIRLPMSRKAFPQGVTSVVCTGVLGRSTSAVQSSIRVKLRHAEEFSGFWHKLNFKATLQGSAGLLGWEFSCGGVESRSSAGGQWGGWDWSGCGKRAAIFNLEVVLPKRGGLGRDVGREGHVRVG